MLLALLLIAAPASQAAAQPEAAIDPRLALLLEPDRAGAALQSIRQGDDTHFIGPLIELLRGEQLGIVRGLTRIDLAASLDSLSGERFGADWSAWVRWYAGTSLEPPLGFTGFKGRLLGRIDPAFARLLAFGVPARIRVEEIVWGGVAFEGIPALDGPTMLPATEASHVEDGEPVFGLALGGEAHAYPHRILAWHELANVVIGGRPVALSYCTLCGSGIAYDARAPGGGARRFGSSGLLMRSNKLMVDHETGSLWSQLTGEAVVGPLAADGAALVRIPVVVTRWNDWRRRHPDTLVLSPETGHVRAYTPGAAYADYFASSATMFPVPAGGPLPEKTRVFGLTGDGHAKAWPHAALRAEPVLNDVVGGEEVVLVSAAEAIEVRGKSERSGAVRRYHAGQSVRAYRRRGQHFRAGPGPEHLIESSGVRWTLSEDALLGPTGARLPRLAGVDAYWFAWRAFHPGSAVFGAR